MSGNVAEWVADVYRPIIDNDANDFSYFRGNFLTKSKYDKEGNVVIVDYNSVEFDTLDNGKIDSKRSSRKCKICSDNQKRCLYE